MYYILILLNGQIKIIYLIQLMQYIVQKTFKFFAPKGLPYLKALYTAIKITSYKLLVVINKYTFW